MTNQLSVRLPRLAANVPPVPLATLPTPVSVHEFRIASVLRPLAVKHDEQSGPVYGGNKVRKLEYLLRWALERGATRIATYGAAGSNHALATALYARRAGLECTCLLSQQPAGRGIGRKLLAHQLNGTEILRFGGPRSTRVALQRRCLQGRNLALIPMGGSNWRGALGFVNAALELAAQCQAGALAVPREVYVATGTLGTAAGLALGFALAGLDVEVRAIRVTDPRFANAAALRRLMHKTAELMRRYDDAVPAGLAARSRVELRGEFFGQGYGVSDDATERAIALAADELGIALEPTYSGKAMAALCHDLRTGRAVRPLFWNTANAVPLDVPAATEPDFTRLPPDFARYFDAGPGAHSGA
jgi:1-aminocyclopropane-1-carboxylate deaminase/D-cysteine desulfhydrase-like pyridoxal-dependent ACC family enzyme